MAVHKIIFENYNQVEKGVFTKWKLMNLLYNTENNNKYILKSNRSAIEIFGAVLVLSFDLFDFCW